MSPLAQVTDFDQEGGEFSEVTDDHVGSPERLHTVNIGLQQRVEKLYLMEVTSQPLVTADLQMRDPRNPFPPATTIFLFAA